MSEESLELIIISVVTPAPFRFAGTIVEVGPGVDEIKWAPGTNVAV